MPDRPTLWRSPAVRGAMLLLPAWFTLAVLVFTTTWQEKLTVGVVLACALASPARALLLVAFVAPLGTFLATILGIAPFRLSEAVVLAFFTGWLLRSAEDRRGPAAPSALGWLFAAAIVASVVAQALQLTRFPGELSSTADLLYHAYYLVADRIGFIDAARLLEGLGLAVASVILIRQHPDLAESVPGALCAASTVAAAAAFLLWRGIAPPAILKQHQLIGYRVSAHIADVNAAGSYFAMALGPALGMMLRVRGRGRILWSIHAAAAAVGLWLAYSLSAMAAAFVVYTCAALWIASTRWARWQRLAVLGLVLAAAAGAAAATVRSPRSTDPSTLRGVFRQEFNATSARMIADRPLFGVGIGQYYRQSTLFLGPQLAWSYGSENAHNYFLQVAAELGLAGFALFAAWVAAPFVRTGRALAAAPLDVRLIGCAGGLAALLATCTTGHPLLLFDVAFPFWILFGLVLALAGSVLINRQLSRAPSTADARIASPLRAAALGIAVCVLVVAPAGAIRQDVEPPRSQAVDGFYGWETDAEGARYRWSGEYASIFVPADVTRVEIPVRRPAPAALKPAAVVVSIDGVRRGTTAVGSGWTAIDVRLPDEAPPVRYKRINLRVDPAWQPALWVAGSADLRLLGVQVGESRLFRDR